MPNCRPSFSIKASPGGCFFGLLLNQSKAGRIFPNRDYAARACRRPIKTSPACQLEMTFPGGFPRGTKGDGSADERWGVVAAGNAARSGSEDQKRLTTAAAAQLLGLERRQVFRLLKAYRAEGATGLISKRRRRRSNRRKPEALRQAALALIRERYWDCGPTPACAGAGFWWRRSYTRFMGSRSVVRPCGCG
jgi:Winged helix-turn helix